MSDKGEPAAIGDDLADVIAKVTEDAEVSGHFDRSEARLAEDREQERRVKQDRELAALDLRGIPKRYATRIVDGDPLPTKAMATVRRFLGSSRETQLVLSGPAGCGKTFAASWLVANGPRSARFLHATHLQRISPYSAHDMSPLESAALLVLDDIGVEFNDDKRMMFSILDGLLETRGGNLRKTVLTTNLALKPFIKRYEGRIVDRLRDGAFVEFNNDSLRGLS